ncbi:LOW QUALITY PROTEIN: S-locus-specific glycoprotein S13-like [Jatropha curcas]|uniref:LOW QUALITY PROTEIN: S-locus-specific glycoprotein S13-like n=1 Tax=Jatropha curcas TaxID=180498 RepID=UPI0018930187|nr:LOW QUALITY PROTEIN: S-locus-specific glycoprotein S13-like [Jatropha curcas]
MIDSTSKNLVLINSNNGVVWSSSNSTKEAQNPVVQLLDSGNLILRDGNNGNSGIYLWQSFDYPTDTLLAGMKIGEKLKPQHSMRLVSWKNWDDPSPGDFFWDLGVVHDIVENQLSGKSSILFRSGPWNGVTFSGLPQFTPSQVDDTKFVRNEEEVYYLFNQMNTSLTYRPVLNQTNNRLEFILWDQTSQSWHRQFYFPSDHCDSYDICGSFGICKTSTAPDCHCLKGFSPKSPENWYSKDFSQGCVRNNSLNCSSDGFIKFTGLKLPDIRDTWANESMNLNECRAKCLQNCSCTAYSSYDIRNGGNGCIIWLNDLTDIREIPVNGQDLYIRMSASELGDTLTSSQSIVDGQTLVSKDGNYELGFFSPGSSRKRYFGIWYKKVSVRTIVWVANQRNAIKDSSSLLTIDNKSKNLVLVSKNSLVWSSNSMKEAENPVGQLLDSGNLVLRDEKNGNSGTYLWQSFDYPTDTLLAGMKLGVKLKPQRSMRLVSWKN